MIYEHCTRKCTRNARFHTDFGRFLVVFLNSNRVHAKRMKPDVKYVSAHLISKPNLRHIREETTVFLKKIACAAIFFLYFLAVFAIYIYFCSVIKNK